MAHHGKRYVEARGRIDRESTYSPVQAVRMLKDVPGRRSSTRPSRCTSASA